MRTVMLAFLGLVLLLAGWTAARHGQDYALQGRETINATGSRAHPAGTDEFGRDRGVRLAVALLISLGGACLASLIATFLAVSLGGLSAFGPPWAASLLRYGSDLFQMLPWLFLFMIVRSALPLNTSPGQSGAITFTLFAVLGAPVFVRINHERTLALVGSAWMLQTRAMGLGLPRQIRQILPHLRPLLWTQFLLYVPACLITEANLGTLGLGLGEPLPSFGTFLAGLQSEALLGGSWLVYLPIVVLVCVLVALELSIFGVEA